MSDTFDKDRIYMEKALKLAQHAGESGEVPVGAVVVKEGEIIGCGANQPILARDPTAHAEIVALRAAAIRLGNYRLPGTTLYVSLEPCCMCVGAIVHARVQRLVYAAPEPRSGAVLSAVRLLEIPAHNHRVEVTSGVMAQASAVLLRQFFQEKR